MLNLLELCLLLTVFFLNLCCCLFNFDTLFKKIIYSCLFVSFYFHINPFISEFHRWNIMNRFFTICTKDILGLTHRYNSHCHHFKPQRTPLLSHSSLSSPAFLPRLLTFIGCSSEYQSHLISLVSQVTLFRRFSLTLCSLPLCSSVM